MHFVKAENVKRHLNTAFDAAQTGGNKNKSEGASSPIRVLEHKPSDSVSSNLYATSDEESDSEFDQEAANSASRKMATIIPIESDYSDKSMGYKSVTSKRKKGISRFLACSMEGKILAGIAFSDIFIYANRMKTNKDETALNIFMLGFLSVVGAVGASRMANGAWKFFDLESH